MKTFFYLLAALALCLLGFGLYQAFLVAPTEATMGPVQRIFYWHVPLNIVGEITPYVNMLASVAYLFLRRRCFLLRPSARTRLRGRLRR